jgi:hypothetical protein
MDNRETLIQQGRAIVHASTPTMLLKVVVGALERDEKKVRAYAAMASEFERKAGNVYFADRLDAVLRGELGGTIKPMTTGYTPLGTDGGA